MRFPIKIDIAQDTQKRSIILQSELGGTDYPNLNDPLGKHMRQLMQDRAILFNHVHRLARCIVDCQVTREDGPATRNALELARSLAARAWDNSPLQMKQIPGLGPVAVRKLVANGITSIEKLEMADVSKLEIALSKQHGGALKILASMKAFPKLRVTVAIVGQVGSVP